MRFSFGATAHRVRPSRWVASRPASQLARFLSQLENRILNADLIWSPPVKRPNTAEPSNGPFEQRTDLAGR